MASQLDNETMADIQARRARWRRAYDRAESARELLSLYGCGPRGRADRPGGWPDLAADLEEAAAAAQDLADLERILGASECSTYWLEERALLYQSKADAAAPRKGGF